MDWLIPLLQKSKGGHFWLPAFHFFITTAGATLLGDLFFLFHASHWAGAMDTTLRLSSSPVPPVGDAFPF